MGADIAHSNLVVAWLWIGAGLVSGMLLGMNFHREDWLGGYSSLKRRLYRLAHISFFGLGILNLAFYLTAGSLHLPPMAAAAASAGFIVGAATMPICCLAMAHLPRLRVLFGIPVASLIMAGMLTLWGVVR